MVRRLLLSYLTLTALVLILLEIPLGIIYARGEVARLAAATERDAVILAELVEEHIETADTGALPTLIASYARRNRVQVVIVDHRGIVLADSAATGPQTHDSLAHAPDIANALHNRSTNGMTRAPALQGEAYYATVPAASGRTIHGAVRLTTPANQTVERIRHAWALLATAGLAALAVTAATGLRLARWITRPVRELERATAQLADGTLTELPQSHLGPPELRRLVTTFTHAATRLQALLHAQQRFAADVSHQLKTPLTALRLRLENLEPDLHPRSHHHLDKALAETERLVRLVQGLLALARTEHVKITPEAVDADAAMHDRVRTWSAFAADNGVTVHLTGQPIGHVRALPGALEQILDNLLDNALRATAAGTTVTIDRTTTDDHTPEVELHVIDEGPGMPQTDCEDAFGRFWRAPGCGWDGTGLGLTIARRLARASGGDITLRRAPRGGLDAVVRLPSANVEGIVDSPIQTC